MMDFNDMVKKQRYGLRKKMDYPHGFIFKHDGNGFTYNGIHFNPTSSEAVDDPDDYYNEHPLEIYENYESDDGNYKISSLYAKDYKDVVVEFDVDTPYGQKNFEYDDRYGNKDMYGILDELWERYEDFIEGQRKSARKQRMKKWSPTIDYTTGNQEFVPGYDDEPQYWNQQQEVDSEGLDLGEKRERMTEELGDCALEFDYVTIRAYDEEEERVIQDEDVSIVALITPLGRIDNPHIGYSHGEYYTSHIFDYDEEHQFQVTVRSFGVNGVDKWYGSRYRFFKRGTELWTLDGGGSILQASSYVEMLEKIKEYMAN